MQMYEIGISEISFRIKLKLLSLFTGVAFVTVWGPLYRGRSVFSTYQIGCSCSGLSLRSCKELLTLCSGIYGWF